MSIYAQIMANMRAMAEKFATAGVTLQLPPHSSKTIGTEYVAIEPGKSLSAKIPFDERFTNPLHMYQGGFMCAAFDEVFGPLTYMTAERPVVTLEMSTSYVRPFTAKDDFIIVKAEVVAKTKTVLLLKAEAHTKDGKLVATASNHGLIVTDTNLKRT